MSGVLLHVDRQQALPWTSLVNPKSLPLKQVLYLARIVFLILFSTYCAYMLKK